MMVDIPHSLEAEQSVIGAIMQGGLEKDVVATAFESLSDDSFYQPAHKQIFEAISKQYARKFAVDLVTLSDAIPEHKDYLIEVYKNCPGYANITYYAKLINEKALERKMVEILNMSLNSMADKSMSHDDKFDHINKLLKEIDSGSSDVEVVKISDVLEPLVEDVGELMKEDKPIGLSTGYPEIDQNIGGLVNGELISLGGRPSDGKSALGMNIAENVAVNGVATLYFTFEMPAKSLAGRVVCSQGRVNNAILKTPSKVDQHEWSKFNAGVRKANDLPIYMAKMSRPKVSQVKAVARNENRKHPIGLIVIDHLHLMNHDNQNDVMGIANTTAELKGLALELDIPILLMSQLNRANSKETLRPPRLTDFRGSGAIEQDSDIAMLIHRDDSEDSELKGKALILIAKNRAGERGTGIVLANNLKNYRFENYAPVEERY